MNPGARTLTRPVLVLFFTFLLWSSWMPAGAQPFPEQCGSEEAGDFIDFESLREKLKEAFEFSNLYEKVANAAADAAVDSLENTLENGGRPEDLETLREQKDNIENGISTILQDLFRESTGEGVDSAHQSAGNARLPSGFDPGEFSGPDPSELGFDDFDLDFDYDEPNLEEAGKIAKKFGDGDVAGGIADLLNRFNEFKKTLRGPVGNQWKWKTILFINKPFSTPEPGVKLELGYDNGRNFRMKAGVEGQLRENGKVEYGVGIGITIKFGGETRSRCATPDVDETPPVCRLAAGGQTQITIEVRDDGEGDLGLGAIRVLRSENAMVDPPPVLPMDPGPLFVIATKIDLTKRSVVELEVEDWEGNVTRCDPVLANLRIPRHGRPSSQTFRGIPQAESRVTIFNGTPGLHTLAVVVNGKPFQMRRLEDGEERTLDVSSAMRSGHGNEMTLRFFGVPGARAMVLIHDSPAPESSAAWKWLPFWMEKR